MKMDTRKISFDILKRIELEDAYVGDVLDSALRTMQFSDKRDRAFITRLVEGVTERKISLDFLIGKFSKKGKSKKQENKIDIQIILRMGIYQIRYMDSVPDNASVSEMVSLAKSLGYEGMAGYINGLLRNVARAKDEKKLDSFLVSRMDARYSTPQWLCDFLTKTYGKDVARTILEDQYAEHDTVVRVNTLKTSVQELKELFEKKGITVNYAPVSESVEENPRMSESESAPAQEIKVELADTMPVIESEHESAPKQNIAETEFIQEHEKPKAPVAKPAPAPVSKPAKTPANLDEIYKNAKPFPEWVDVVSNMKPISRAIAAAFSGSAAYVSGNYLLIDTSNEMAFELLKNGTRREEIRKIILETTGRVYKLGPYKRAEEKKKETDPLDVLKNGLEGTGIKITEE